MSEGKENKGRKSGIGRLERMKHGNGKKDRDDRSKGTEILMTDVFDKINPTNPFRLVKQVARRKLTYYR